jgi:LmbE family N-acetylglucosaminyl deacetylase
VTHTVVCFHAHPDDESLYTGGTMARLAAEGHRVVLVTATAGGAGLASSAVHARGLLGEIRQGELAHAAAILGCARVVGLGYGDSGMGEEARIIGATFSSTPVEEAAIRLAQVLTEEQADAITVYDAAGGYGHPDHRQVHRVGCRAAALVGTPLVLEATVDRQALQQALRLVSWAMPGSPDLRPSRYDTAYTERSLITHCVDVCPYVAQKRAALKAHYSQTTSDGGRRALSGFLRLPPSLFRAIFGREWFVEHGRAPVGRTLDDILASLSGPADCG